MKKSNISFCTQYFRGISWFILSLLISACNDILVKFVSDVPAMQVAFLRFGFGCLVLLPFMMWSGLQSFATKRLWIHLVRGGILFVAMSMWCYSLGIVPVVHATLITFTIPLFVLVLARIFLKEKITKQLIIATLIGFAGALMSFDITNGSFHIGALLLLVAALLFAGLDIINKKFASSESMLSMLFYSALVTTALGALPAYYTWQTLTMHQWTLMAVLGMGGNLILYFLLQAFKLVQASAVAPYRYLELLFSGAIGLIVFGDLPDAMLLLSSCLIIPSTIFIAIYEQRNKKYK